ncbi:unnamed protein product [Haemonchus placei]|uniref:Ras-associating domain-containing protein n=1 Tax=Haemonchus placei TaxID=6290 RepID=A0A0N4WXW4_HAEPC|nr:unnamed protein product [Haemonchus placei]
MLKIVVMSVNGESLSENVLGILRPIKDVLRNTVGPGCIRTKANVLFKVEIEPYRGQDFKNPPLNP